MYRTFPLAILGLALFLGSCQGGRAAFSSGDRLEDVKKVRTAYQAKDYEESKRLIEAIFQTGFRTGDLAFYYGKTLDVLNGSTNALPEVIAAYEEATNWFGRFRSEFPEDRNRDKAYYNLGVMYSRKSAVQDLHRVLAIWDESRRAGADAILKQEKQYDAMVFQLPLFDAEMTARRIRDGLTRATTAEDLKAVDEDFRRNLKSFQIKPFLERDGLRPSDLLLELLRRYDDLASERRKELRLP